MKFSELSLSPKVLAAVEAAGYDTPTPIQAQAIPVAVNGRDVLGIAQTGTGKTASFVLPMLTRLERGRARARMPRSLIVAPTRELAAQVAESFEQYGAGHKITLALLIGGVSFDEQFRKLDRGVDVLIATPGRLLDHFGRGKLLLTAVEILVIDEADRMLDMGFIPDIERICKLLPPRRQTLFFSATMPPEIQRLVKSFLNDPARIEVAPQSTTAENITQRFHFCSAEPREKRKALRKMIRAQSDIKNAIVFCNRKRDVAVLLKSFKKHGFDAAALHGDMDQRSRTETLDAFRNGEVTILAASDVAARGLDIPDVSHIFNFDVPVQAEDYVHRVGRTGRAGREGFALTLVTPEDAKVLKEIGAFSSEAFEWIGDAPGDDDFDDRRGRRGRRRAPPSKPARGAREGKDQRPKKRGGRRRDASDAKRSKPASGEAAKKPSDKPAASAQAEKSPPPKREPRKSDRRKSGGRKRREEAVIGLGDHVPDFMKRG